MTRYRPPAKPVSNYITAEGEKKLQQELQYLWKQERPLVTRQVSEAAALGDRSENAEYIYGKKRLREIDRRVGFLSNRLEQLNVVSRKPDDTSKVYFGARVALEDEKGNELSYRLVGPDEIDLQNNAISIDSPLGRALLGKRIDSEITISSPAGKKSYILIGISYS
jgi:transcription elongation factor GreB